jgi:hypothetical protein
VADGCGGELLCGGCGNGMTCGGGGQASVCGNPPDAGACVPKTCLQVGIGCGPAGDGCGGVLNCGGCTPPQTCGGGGMASHCGGSNGCVPHSCMSVGANCGPIADGCGNQINCGSTCPVGETCGGAGVSSHCGSPPDAGPACTPRTCASVGANCGPLGDGCGGVLNCGTTCPMGETCGGGGTPNVCGNGTTTCVPRSCQQAGANCGPVADGCGGVLACGRCTPPQTCGGGGTASVCGGGPDAGVGAPCTNLCQQQTTCPTPGVTTTLSGTVVAPTPPAIAAPDPVYNAVVYVPNAPVQPFTPGVACERCSTPSGSPLVTAVTGPDGQFKLYNVPVGTNIPLVIQLGRWRRQIKIPRVTACQTTVLTQDQTRLPRNHTEGDIPLTAMVTGKVDALECVLRKIGIDDAEFTVPVSAGGSGRIQMFMSDSNGAGADVTGGGAPLEDTLWSSTTALAAYDLVMFACEGGQYDEASSPNQTNMQWFVDHGGRMYNTHYSYVWLYNYSPFSLTGAWNPDVRVSNPPPDPLDALVDRTFPKGRDFAQWLVNVGSSTAAGHITIHVPRRDINGVNAPAQRWIYANTSPESIEHYTFNTPWGVPAAQQCGRVLYSDFHVNGASTQGKFFPGECTAGGLTQQEKILEFMMFDLASCIQPDVPQCTPRNCMQQGATCGPVGDGCGNVIQCGVCTLPQTCGGGGVPSHCGGGVCVPKTCAQENLHCGPAGDGCGGTLNCGPCPAGETCGGGGTRGVCGSMDAGTCIPLTCPQQNLHCGPAGDGCGNLIDCGPCPMNQTCGGGGMNGVCGASSCVPLTCMQQNIACGPAGNGCGGEIASCGTCPPGETCGGGGVPGHCGSLDSGSCVPRTCPQLGISCGPAGDGCGGLLNCGTCTPPLACGAGGTPGVCGMNSCMPLSCTGQGINCGPAGDGCGGQLNCGTCPPGQTCGGGGRPGVCGTQDGGSCVPLSCAQQSLQCGPAGDGCGGSIDCGLCSENQSCGATGMPGVCVVNMCTPLSCAQQGISCGPAGDGCGGMLACGSCTLPETCGGSGIPGVCGIQGSSCVPETCAAQHLSCGPAGDGCGGTLDCGPCPSGESCGGGGIRGQCGTPPCTATSCGALGLSCGPAGDGCGGMLDCGSCSAPLTCGGAGQRGVCGLSDGGVCVPLTCSDQGLSCGPAGDGCGGMLDCGPCPMGQSCGGGGTPGVCGTTCVARDCASVGANCGPLADGCGGNLFCGNCTPPAICGGSGMANVCGSFL